MVPPIPASAFNDPTLTHSNIVTACASSLPLGLLYLFPAPTDSFLPFLIQFSYFHVLYDFWRLLFPLFLLASGSPVFPLSAPTHNAHVNFYKHSDICIYL